MTQSADAFRRALLVHDSVAERQLLDSYALVWAAIRASLDALLRDMAERQSAGLDVSPAWLFRQERYKALLVQVEQQVGGLARSLNGALQGQAAYAAMLGASNGVELIGQSLGAGAFAGSGGIGLTFSRLPGPALSSLVGGLAGDSPLSALLEKLGAAAATSVKRALIVGVATGQNPRVIARLVRDQAGVTLTRALTVARTETLRAYRDAALDTYYANSDVVQGWVWHSALGTRTCAFCWSMHGSFHPLSEAFASHPNCLPAGAVVTGAQVRASTTRWYEGEIIDIETVNGNRLAVTPNHTILTPEGWVAAGLLHEGGDVISSSNPERLAADVDPDDYQRPALIEDIAEACGGAPGVLTVAVPTAAEDFHGDGVGSQISVVRANRLLGSRFHAALAQPDFQEALVSGHAKLGDLPGSGSLALLFPGMHATASGSIRGLGVAPVLFGGAAGGHETISGQRVAGRYAGYAEPGAYGGAGDAETFGQLVFRVAGQVVGNDLPIWQSGSSAIGSRGSLADHPVAFGLRAPQPPLQERGTKPLMADMEALGRHLARLPGTVGSDRILKIGRRSFRGHVYNLETSAGWYIANSIITHNCRCAPIPATRSYAELGIAAPDTRQPVPLGADLFENLDSARQRRILGPGAYSLYADGQITLADMASFGHSQDWGRYGYVTPLYRLKRRAAA